MYVHCDRLESYIFVLFVLLFYFYTQKRFSEVAAIATFLFDFIYDSFSVTFVGLQSRDMHTFM
jgi:hypothetical protein